MAPRGGQPHDMGEQGRSLFHEKIATFYYTFGLFSISYPIYVLLFSISIIVISWFPLMNLPYPGKAPHAWTGNLSSADISEPFCYVQQVVMRVTVLPWESDLTLGDAFRAPLYESFKLLDIVRNHQNEQSMKTLGHVCLHIEAVKRGKLDPKGILPQYNCLVLSPANFWHQDVHRFSQDRALLTTVFNQHSFQKGKTSIAEILFGMHLFDTGIKRYPIRNRQRIIQYAVTLFYNEYDEQFIESLQHKLIRLYPLHQNGSAHIPLKAQDTLFIQYPGEINYIEVSPIVVSFIIIFMYYYFSVRKIDMIKSKVGMALTATITVFCSLTTTMGICFFFGLTMHFCGSKGIFPYLVMLVGLENVLVLTKSVVSTPLHLDVKIRNAQGLSREGWSITKNLMFELTVMTFGLFTFVPVIQEFSIFCIVALIMDYFLQIFFFATILGIDISRTVNSNEKTTQNYRYSLYQTPNSFEKQINMKSMTRSKSHPRLSSYPTNVVAAQKQSTQEKRIPKRLQLVNIWARTRFFQRSFMLLMIVYISMIVYNSNLINQYILNVVQEKDKEDNNSLYDAQNYKTVTMFPLIDPNNSIPVKYVTYKPVDNRKSPKLSSGYTRNETQGLEKLKHPEYSAWQKLSLRHWFTILRKYNISLSAKTIAVLPCIKLSHVISPEQAVLIRNPDEKYGDKFHWQALAAALDPIDFTDTESSEGAIPQQDQPFYPTSPMEILLTTILCVISILVLSYALVVVYRCVCSRNYAEWRASWSNEKSEESGEEQVLLEAVPIVLDGHQQEIECLSTDGTNIVSTCLDGHLKVWDSNTGQLVIHIDRNSYFVNEKRQDLSLEYDDTFSDYESSSPPSREDNFPKLLNKINTDFSHNVDGECSAPSDSKYDFHKSYRHFYFNHNYDVRLRHKYECSQSDSKRHSLSGDNNWKPTQFHSENLKDDVSEYRNNSVPNVNSAMSSRDVRDHNNCENCRLSPIWCIDYLNNLIVIGCADGRLEFWEGSTGKLKCIFEDETESGISHVKMVGCKIIATRLSGTLELYQLQTYNQGRPVDWNFSCAYKRTHVRTGSLGSNSEREGNNQIDNVEDLHVIKLHTVRAHQQPVTCLDCEGGRILTGSQDHTLKVFRLDDTRPLYTLHGHCGPITCLFIDRISPGTSGSGSQDGMLCVWDLMTGACMYSIQAHDGSITSLTYSTSYVISLGTDERLCVWERFQGHLLNTIYVSHTFSNKVLMLAQHLAITGRSSGLVIWDVRTGECVRTITLGHIPFIFINQLLLLRDAVLCDYGKQLSIVRFPLITHKFD